MPEKPPSAFNQRKHDRWSLGVGALFIVYLTLASLLIAIAAQYALNWWWR